MKTLIVIITDAGFLVPSLALVNQIHESAAATGLADVLFVKLDLDPDLAEITASTLAGTGARLLCLNTRDLNLPNAAHYFDRHVPATALARLAIYDHLPAEYENIIYLDGDVRVVSDISGLLSLNVPASTIAACAETFICWRVSMALVRHGSTPTSPVCRFPAPANTSIQRYGVQADNMAGRRAVGASLFSCSP